MKSMREARLPIAAMVVILMVLGGAMQGQSSADCIGDRLQDASQLRQTARVVALDERQHHERGH